MKMLMAVLLVAFATSTVVASVQATAMELQMSLSADGGCSECPAGADDVPLSCAAGCVVSVNGLADFSATHVFPILDKAPPPAFVQSMSGWQAPPDPFPPRTPVLN
jgi:hypothetical protein